MDLLTAQILAILIIVVISFIVGSIPIVIGHKFKLTSEKRGGKANVRAQILAFLMNFGGGVLIGLSLCHWLPETREGNKIQILLETSMQNPRLRSFFPQAIEAFNFNTELAVTEILVVTGFFLICGIDVALHMLLGPYLHRRLIQ